MTPFDREGGHLPDDLDFDEIADLGDEADRKQTEHEYFMEQRMLAGLPQFANQQVRKALEGDRIRCCNGKVAAIWYGINGGESEAVINHTADCPHGQRSEHIHGQQLVITLADGCLGVAVLNGRFPHEQQGVSDARS